MTTAVGVILLVLFGGISLFLLPMALYAEALLLAGFDPDSGALSTRDWKAPPDEQLEEGWEAMVKLQEQGKVRYVGVSNCSVSQLKRTEQIQQPVSLQPPYSMIRRDAEEELLSYCKENNMGVVVYSPMQKGLLTDKYTARKVAELAPDDHRHRDPNFHGERLEANMKLVDGITAIAQRYGRTSAQLAIAWVLRRQEVTAAIVGARSRKQIEETVQAGGWELTGEDIAEIELEPAVEAFSE